MRARVLREIERERRNSRALRRGYIAKADLRAMRSEGSGHGGNSSSASDEDDPDAGANYGGGGNGVLPPWLGGDYEYDVFSDEASDPWTGGSGSNSSRSDSTDVDADDAHLDHFRVQFAHYEYGVFNARPTQGRDPASWAREYDVS